jgi:hypothetical protein
LKEERFSEKAEVKKFLAFEKENIYNIKEISLKNQSSRTKDEKNYYIMFLKYKIPFFKSF